MAFIFGRSRNKYTVNMSLRIPFLFILLTALIATRSIAQETPPEIAFKLYNNLYSQKANYDDDSKRVTDRYRRSFITNILEVTIKPHHKRFDWGFDTYYRASLQHAPADSPFDVAKYQSNALTAQHGLSHIGPKLILRPTKKNEQLQLKFIGLIPIGGGQTNLSSSIPALDNSGLQLWSQVNYNGKLLEQVYGYAELSFVGRLGRDNAPKNDLFIPIKGFLSYFPFSKAGIFGWIDYTPTIASTPGYYFQAGGGIKLFPAEGWEVELSTSQFLAGRNVGAGYSFNLGLGYVVKPEEKE